MRLIPQALRRGPWRTLPDTDVLQSLIVAGVACAATLGVLWVGYAAWAWRIAARAPTQPGRARSVLLFGKRLVAGDVDADYLARIVRAHEVVRTGRADRVVLLGGASTPLSASTTWSKGGAGDTATPGGTSEAAAALRVLRRMGLPDRTEVLVDESSLDTLENLRNARALLGVHAREPVALVSSRYHLPRTAFLARRLGFDYELCAAEGAFTADFRLVRRIAIEAAYLLWMDVGTRWARLTGQQRVLEQIS